MLFEQAARLVRNLAGVTIRVSLHTRIFLIKDRRRPGEEVQWRREVEIKRS